MLPSRFVPLAITLGVLLVIAGIIGRMALSTARRIVASESTPQREAAYRRWRPEKERDRLESDRAERYELARKYHRVFAWCVTIVVGFVMTEIVTYVFMVGMSMWVVGFAALVGFLVVLLSYSRFVLTPVTFPDLIEMRERDGHDTDADAEGDVTGDVEAGDGMRDTRLATATATKRHTANVDKRSRRKMAASSRKANRSRR